MGRLGMQMNALNLASEQLDDSNIQNKILLIIVARWSLLLKSVGGEISLSYTGEAQEAMSSNTTPFTCKKNKKLPLVAITSLTHLLHRQRTIKETLARYNRQKDSDIITYSN